MFPPFTVSMKALLPLAIAILCGLRARGQGENDRKIGAYARSAGLEHSNPWRTRDNTSVTAGSANLGTESSKEVQFRPSSSGNSAVNPSTLAPRYIEEPCEIIALKASKSCNPQLCGDSPEVHCKLRGSTCKMSGHRNLEMKNLCGSCTCRDKKKLEFKRLSRLKAHFAGYVEEPCQIVDPGKSKLCNPEFCSDHPEISCRVRKKQCRMDGHKGLKVKHLCGDCMCLNKHSSQLQRWVQGLRSHQVGRPSEYPEELEEFKREKAARTQEVREKMLLEERQRNIYSSRPNPDPRLDSRSLTSQVAARPSLDIPHVEEPCVVVRNIRSPPGLCQAFACAAHPDVSCWKSGSVCAFSGHKKPSTRHLCAGCSCRHKNHRSNRMDSRIGKHGTRIGRPRLPG